MGLAASQARLLTITARKADCEFQSMRYSHQKIALSRNMTDISNEYQNSLNQTKLVYDYYGNNDKSLSLTYGLMMTPSELNGHMPILTTDSSGKIVLNTQYAAAARAAGIPQEGLGCLPSTTIRNKFLDELATVGIITPIAAESYKAVTYAQEMGLGTSDLVTSTVKQMNLQDMMDHYKLNGNWTSFGELSATTLKEKTGGDAVLYNGDETAGNGSVTLTDCKITDIIEGDLQYIVRVGDGDRESMAKKFETELTDLWEWMFEELATMLNVTGDAQIAGAIQVAESMTRELLEYSKHHTGFRDAAGDGHSTMNASAENQTTDKKNFAEFFGFNKNKARIQTSGYFGSVMLDRKGSAWNWKPREFASIDISNIAKAYLTYFAQYMEGGERYSDYKVDDETNKVSESHLIDENFMFDVLVEQGINTNQALNSGFYDAMFNQICLKGWVENANVDDEEYLQEMFQSGVLYISTCNDDGNYYQGNYSTNSFIKEVADEDAIAKAEAKYNTEKQKINSKEEVLDMKMKNLDTEISSLTTEYDTIKSVISKNIEKSFKRYDA
ncbi:MAG: hypothetical protein E7Z93_04755 [Cyanobacteria bacterium SIG32]|nr:hypothetical protein [Cyanobacteria bacterium SIG32]